MWELRVSTGRDPVTGKYGEVSGVWPGYAGDDPDVRTASQRTGEAGRRGRVGARRIADRMTVDQLLARWVRASLGRAAPRRPLPRVPTTDRQADIAGPRRPAGRYRELRDTRSVLQRPVGHRAQASVVRQVHSVLRAAFKEGVRLKLVATNPASLAKRPKDDAKPDRVPTPAEVQKVIAAAEAADADLGAYIALAAVTGARRGELCGLRSGE